MPNAIFYTGIQLRTQVFVVLIGLAMLALVLNLVRRKRLREDRKSTL